MRFPDLRPHEQDRRHKAQIALHLGQRVAGSVRQKNACRYAVGLAELRQHLLRGGIEADPHVVQDHVAPEVG